MELSTKQGAIGYVIMQNKSRIDAARNMQELIQVCEEMLIDSNNCDKENFLSNVKSKKDHFGVLNYIYNYMFKGDGFGVI